MHGIKRKVSLKVQKGSSKENRQRQLKGLFYADAKIIRGKNIILIVCHFIGFFFLILLLYHLGLCQVYSTLQANDISNLHFHKLFSPYLLM